MKRFAATAVILSFLAVAATAGASPLRTNQVYTMTNPPKGLPVKAIEAAIEGQVTTQLQTRWGTGQISFGPGGIPIHFESLTFVDDVTCGSGALACHVEGPARLNGRPSIWVARQDLQIEEIAIDHEILETEVDPYFTTNPTETLGQVSEVCDPVEDYTYQSAFGTWMSPFVYRSYFQTGNATHQTAFVPPNTVELGSAFGRSL